jgi:PAS domain S-box-containing protein
MSTIKRSASNSETRRESGGGCVQARQTPVARLGEDVELLPMPALVFDDRGVIIHRNKAAVESLGFDPARMNRRDLFARTSPRFGEDETISADRSIVARALAGEGVKSAYGAFVNAEGQEHLSRATAGPIRSGTEVAGVILMWHDIAEQRPSELATEETSLVSRRLADMGALAAVVAHELRNPLGVMRAALYNIRKKNTNPEIEKHITNIEKKVEESSEIINNLLSYARIKAPDYRPVKLAAVLAGSIAAARRRFKGKKVRVRRDLGPVEDLTIGADPDQLEEVFLNVLTNAYEAVPPHTGTIVVSARPEGENMVEIGIEDNGTGIDAADLGRLFEPFFTRKPRGTGLGLPISHRIVQLHGGTIRIESTVGAGTRVTVRLPIARM